VAVTRTFGWSQVSGVVKRTALKLSKICNDLRLLSSGPRSGFKEINLPAVQPGSSIMPGKVNPVIPEVVNQVAYEVAGNDVTIGMAAEAGQLQLNAFEPIIAHSLFQSLSHLNEACRTLVTRLHPRYHREPPADVRVGGELDRSDHRVEPLHRLFGLGPASPRRH
jgi:aspartate ammonia-lyase